LLDLEKILRAPALDGFFQPTTITQEKASPWPIPVPPLQLKGNSHMHPSPQKPALHPTVGYKPAQKSLPHPGNRLTVGQGRRRR